MWVSSRQEYGVRSLVVAVFWHMAMYRFFNINLADVVLNRARNIDSQFGSEQRKAGRSVFFASSLRKKKEKNSPLIFLSIHSALPHSFLLPCPSIWTSLSRDMAFPACSRKGFSTFSFSFYDFIQSLLLLCFPLQSLFSSFHRMCSRRYMCIW